MSEEKQSRRRRRYPLAVTLVPDQADQLVVRLPRGGVLTLAQAAQLALSIQALLAVVRQASGDKQAL